MKASVAGDDYMGSLLNTPILLPQWDVEGGQSSKVAYRFWEMGTFKIVGYDFNGSKQAGLAPPPSTPKDKYIMLQYIKDSTGGTANGCS